METPVKFDGGSADWRLMTAVDKLVGGTGLETGGNATGPGDLILLEDGTNLILLENGNGLQVEG